MSPEALSITPVPSIASFALLFGLSFFLDPFVLNLAQGGASGVPAGPVAAAILVAASSINLLKAVYAASFAGRRIAMPSAAALIVLALGGIALAVRLVGS